MTTNRDRRELVQATLELFSGLVARGFRPKDAEEAALCVYTDLNQSVPGYLAEAVRRERQRQERQP